MSTPESGKSQHKNKVSQSTVSAKGNVHIGDQVVNNHYGPVPPKTKKGLSFKIIGFTIAASATLIGVTFNFDNLLEFNYTPKEGKETGTTADTTLREESGQEPSAPVRPQQTPNENKLTEEPSAKPAPKEEKPLSYYTNQLPGVKMAFVTGSSLQLSEFSNAIREYFDSEGLNYSDQFFRPTFYSKYGRELENFDLGALQSTGLTDQLLCICQIQESIQYETEQVEGMDMVVARGVVTVHLLQLKEGKMQQRTFRQSGAGMSDSAALESLQEHLLSASDLSKIAIQKCQ